MHLTTNVTSGVDIFLRMLMFVCVSRERKENVNFYHGKYYQEIIIKKLCIVTRSLKIYFHKKKFTAVGVDRDVRVSVAA